MKLRPFLKEFHAMHQKQVYLLWDYKEESYVLYYMLNKRECKAIFGSPAAAQMIADKLRADKGIDTMVVTVKGR